MSHSEDVDVQAPSMSDAPRDARSKDRQLTLAACLLLTLLICVALDTIHLGPASLWSDEIFSRYYYKVFGSGFMFGEAYG